MRHGRICTPFPSSGTAHAHLKEPSMSSNSPEIYGFGPFLLDVGARRLQRGDAPVALTPKVFDMLVILVRAAGTVVAKDALMKELWPDSFVEEGNLTQSVFLLRKALGADETYVETSPRRGYRF